MKKTKKVSVGGILIGGGKKIAVQSMCNTFTADVGATVKQIERLTEAGCDIVRVAVPDMEAAGAIKEIKKRISIPLVADIHFDYRLALEAVRSGADKIRINPGNIGGNDRLRQVVEACRERGIPIRVGVNGGSVSREIKSKYDGVTAEALLESAEGCVSMLEALDFYDTVISVKASSVKLTVETNRLISERFDYPLHLGITETGSVHMGIIKSAAGIGSLLMDGIGDTVRVSLTADPVEEVKAAYEIMRAVGAYKKGVDLISCPTCGRTRINIESMVNELDAKLKHIEKNITVAVMGCAVNGPGEASEADVGIAGGDGDAVLFRKGKIVCKLSQNEVVERLCREVEELEKTN